MVKTAEPQTEEEGWLPARQVHLLDADSNADRALAAPSSASKKRSGGRGSFGRGHGGPDGAASAAAPWDKWWQEDADREAAASSSQLELPPL